MIKCAIIVFLILACVNKRVSIILPDEEVPKPTYTAGIKTRNWRNADVQTHQNYSRVTIHNNPSSSAQYVVTLRQKTKKVYPIYNGNSYDQKFEGQQQIIEDNNRKNVGLDTMEHNTRPIYKRKIEYNTLAIYEKCPEGATGLYVYYMSCNQYLNCWKGKGTIQNCAPGTLFNPRTLECDYPDKVECITGPTANLIGNLRIAKSIKQATCPSGFSGIIPNYNNCSKYINCNDGQLIEMDCPPGTLFDIKRNLCDFPNKATCFNGDSVGISQGIPHLGNDQYACYSALNCAKSGTTYPIQGQQVGSGSNYFGKGQTSLTGQAEVAGACNPQIQNCSPNIGQFPVNLNYKTYGQTGCNPQTENCGVNVKQFQNFPNVGKTTNHQSTAQFPIRSNTNVYGQTRCNPHTQNCGSNIGQGLQVSQTTNYKHSVQQPASTNFQSYGQRQCNPQTQNCGQYYANAGSQSTKYRNVEQSPINFNSDTQTQCNPQIQNCGQNYPNTGRQTINYGNVGQHPVEFSSQGHSQCNPQTQNCGQNYLNAGSQSINYGNFGKPPTDFNSQEHSQCNPQTQNCGSHNINYENIGQRPIAFNSGSQIQCNPKTQNCAQNIGQNICNPQIQNCFQINGQGSSQGQPTIQPDRYEQTPNENVGYGSQTSGKCNPFLQNCTTINNSNSTPAKCNPFLEHCPGFQNIKTTTQRPRGSNSDANLKPNCNPFLQNCSPDLTGDDVRSHNGCKGGACRSNRSIIGENYNRICNINDPGCLYAKTDASQKPKCPKNFQGITKHPFNCKKFLNCANGLTFIQDCAPGTLFNPALGNCDFPYNVDCENASSEPTESGNTESYDENSWKAAYDAHSDIYSQNSGHGNVRVVPTATTSSASSQWSGLNYDRNPVVDTNRGQIGLVNRFQLTTPNPISDQTINKFPDYVDVFDPKDHRFPSLRSTTARSISAWPPPFPATDLNADYAFEYEDGEPVTLQPDNIFHSENRKISVCDKGDFHCTSTMCITKTMVCDGHRDCEHGKDEYGCEEYIGRFRWRKNHHLNVLERERWINVSYTTCALLCIDNTHFNCRSFNYRNMDNTCFLSDTNVGLSGALRQYQPYDYYELTAGTVDCSDKNKYFECPNKKCIKRGQLCDGVDDCADRKDEQGCKAGDFGYSIKLAGSKELNEGRVEVTAFGNTGYICDDQFGLRDANVICRELGYELGAADIKGQSFFARDLKEKDTLYMMDDLDCIGNETSIIDCGFSGWGVHDCRDQEIAGVVCKTFQETCGNDQWKCDTGNECLLMSFVCDDVNDCSDNSDEAIEHCEAPTQIRLVNGTSPNQGRVEITHYGMWGTICDDDFNEDAAKVVCKSLGYTGSGIVKKNSYYGSGEGPIWLDQVSCYGNETELKDCTNWDWGVHNCDHTEDVGVICSNETNVGDIQRNIKFLHYFGENTGLPTHCGYRKNNQFLEEDSIHARVVSGFRAKKGDYPWQAAIRVKARDKTAHWCGAVIISRKWVMTAAHCLQGYAKGAYIIIAGDYDIDENEGTEQQKYIDEYYIHENFRKKHKMDNDIALIRLKGEGFVLNDDVQPICLPQSDTFYGMDLNCTISGFGSVKSGIAAYSHNMMAAWLPIHSNDICKMPHIYNNSLTEGMFCAGSLDGGIDACDGDSGGPLACLDQGLFTLYGITSWGHHCGYANKPGVYVKVSHYRKWIDGIIEKHSQ